MYNFIESWTTYKDIADMIQRRWVYNSGINQSLEAGGLMFDYIGSLQDGYTNCRVGPMKRIHIGVNVTCFNFSLTQLNSSFIHLMSDGNGNIRNQIGFGFESFGGGGVINVFRGSDYTGRSSGETLAVGSTILTAGTNYWIEYDVLIGDGTSGSIEVRINGIPEILISGVDTDYRNSGYVNYFGFAIGASLKRLIGGMYISDGSEGWIGPSDVKRLLLTGETARKDFTLVGGSTSVSSLNDRNDNTSYVSSTDINSADIYSIQPISELVTADPVTVHAVQVCVKSLQNDSVNRIKVLSPVVRIGGQTISRGARNLPSNFTSQWFTEPVGIFDKTPQGEDFTPTTLTAMEVGMRVSPFFKGFNFRATETYVTDPVHCTYVLNDVYPTTRAGITFGWNTAGTGTVRLNRGTFDARFAGINCQQNNGTQRTFRVDVPKPGRYQIRLILGDNSGFTHNPVYCRVQDGTTELFTIVGTLVTQVPYCHDAVGATNYSMLAWEEFNRPRDVVLTGTVLNITIGTPVATGVDFSCITHLELVALDEDVALVSQAPEVRVSGLYVETMISTALSQASRRRRPALFG